MNKTPAFKEIANTPQDPPKPRPFNTNENKSTPDIQIPHLKELESLANINPIRSARNSVRRPSTPHDRGIVPPMYDEFSPLLTPQTRMEQFAEEKFSLRDIYLDLPSCISEVLIEAGITNLLNCIQIQKKLVLTCHYLSKQIKEKDLDFQKENNQDVTNIISKKSAKSKNSNQREGIDQFLTKYIKDNYLKESTLNYEKSQELSSNLIKQAEKTFNLTNQFTKIFKFLKNGASKYTNNASIIAPQKVHDNDLHFREFYNLKDFDMIDEAEEVATHLMSELSMSQNEPIFQSLSYPDDRIFEGFYKNGMRNGHGKQIL